MTTIDDYDRVFEGLLGRPLNATERPRVAARLAEPDGGPSVPALVAEVLRSDEFFMRHREAFAARFFPEPCVVAARTPLGDEVLADLRQFHLGFAIAGGHFEPNETAFVRNTVRRGQTVVDVGANIGYFTTMFARLVGNEGKVFAFEPVEDSFRKLSWAVERASAGHIVRLHPFALSDDAGETSIVYERRSLNIGAARFGAAGDGAAGLREQRVRTARLDDVLAGEPVDFLKIDVEGAEHLVMQGAPQALARRIPFMMVEFNAAQLAAVSGVTPATLLGLFLDHGYGAHALEARGRLAALPDPRSALDALLARSGVVNLVMTG
jgi:FkbM family methyltransferase